MVLTLAAAQSVFATDWSVVRSGGLAYVDSNKATAFYYYAKSGETLSLTHFGGPTNLFCAYSSIDNPTKFLGDKVVAEGGSMILKARATNLYIVACVHVSGAPGNNVLGVLKTSAVGKKLESESDQNDYSISSSERDILLEELHEYIDGIQGD